MSNFRNPFWLSLIGFTSSMTGHKEKLLSGLGGIIGVYAVWLVTNLFIDHPDTPLIVASMGASAVLLFAVPHGQFSQPWNLCAGHVFSAIIGVSCAMTIPDQALAAATAVGLAIVVMHYTQSIHPPGGATALMAVIGGSSIHNIGFSYVITPVLINVLVILFVAFLFNYPFSWRRYPEAIAPVIDNYSQTHFEHQDLQYALQQAGGCLPHYRT